MTIDHLGIIEGSIQDGGWQATGNIYGDADRLDWYKAVTSWLRVYRGGAWEKDLRIAFSGHLMPESWDRIFQSSIAPWTGFTCQEFMKNGRIQGIFYAENASPGNNHQITNMTYADIVQEILGNAGEYGHCNLVDGIWPEGFASLNIDTANSVLAGVHLIKEGNFWQRLQEIASIENYLLYVSKDNTINYIPHPMYGTLPSVTMDFTSSHFLEPLTITPRNSEQVGQVQLQGTTPGGEQITATYPTNATAGPIIKRAGYKAADSTGMSTVATRMYLYENRPFSVKMKLPGAQGLLFDLMDRVSITYSSAADGITWSAQKFWVEGIRVSIQDNFRATSELTLESENTA